VDQLGAIRKSDWNNAHRVEAELTVRPEASGTLSIPPIYSAAKITSSWPDARRINFEVHPKEESRQLCRLVLDSNFKFWTRGCNFN
jgi:hypothetical protein